MMLNGNQMVNSGDAQWQVAGDLQNPEFLRE
jgi:hypothetical protein